MDAPAFVPQQIERLDVRLSSEQLSLLGAYLDHLLDVNRRMNLTAVREPDAAWRRLIIDSLTVLPWLADLPAGAKVIDVGSGAGLPGLPIAVARPDLRVTLLEATGKKARFLGDCIRLLKLDHVSVVNARAEEAGHDPAHRQRYDTVVCRAIGPMRELLEYTLPLAKVGAVLLTMKGPTVQTELDDAGDALLTLGGGEVQVYDAYPDGFDIHTVVVRVTKDQPTPRAYPRPPGTPHHSPL